MRGFLIIELSWGWQVWNALWFWLAGQGGESKEGVHPLAGQGGVWAPMFMYRAKVTWVWCIAHVSTQDLGGSIYIDFCLPCQPKQSKHLGFGTLRSTFSEGALLTMSVVVFRVKVNAFPQNLGGSIYLDFLFTLSAKTIKTPRVWNFEVNFFRRRLVHNERGHVSSQSHLGLMFLTRCPTLICQPKESSFQDESNLIPCQPS